MTIEIPIKVSVDGATCALVKDRKILKVFSTNKDKVQFVEKIDGALFRCRRLGYYPKEYPIEKVPPYIEMIVDNGISWSDTIIEQKVRKTNLGTEKYNKPVNRTIRWLVNLVMKR